MLLILERHQCLVVFLSALSVLFCFWGCLEFRELVLFPDRARWQSQIGSNASSVLIIDVTSGTWSQGTNSMYGKLHMKGNHRSQNEPKPEIYCGRLLRLVFNCKQYELKKEKKNTNSIDVLRFSFIWGSFCLVLSYFWAETS